MYFRNRYTDEIKSKAPETSNQNDQDRRNFQHKYILSFRINNSDQGSKGEIIKLAFGIAECHMIFHRRWLTRGMYLAHYTYCVCCIFQRTEKKELLQNSPPKNLKNNPTSTETYYYYSKLQKSPPKTKPQAKKPKVFECLPVLQKKFVFKARFSGDLAQRSTWK